MNVFPDRFERFIADTLYCDSAPTSHKAIYIFLAKSRNAGEIDYLSWHPSWHRSMNQFLLLADALSPDLHQPTGHLP